jgi:hypothetical protein
VCAYDVVQGSGKKGKSMAEIQRAIERKRKRISQGLPDWGKDLPDDVCVGVVINNEEASGFPFSSFLSGWSCLKRRVSGNKRS